MKEHTADLSPLHGYGSQGLHMYQYVRPSERGPGSVMLSLMCMHEGELTQNWPL